MGRGTNESIGEVAHQVALLLRRAEASRRRVGQLDRSAYLLLSELAVRGPLSIAALAQTFQLDLSTASRQVAALEAKQLVERLADPADGRISILEITPRGRAAVQTTREARHALYAQLLEDWPEEERRAFGTYLARLNQAIARRPLR